MKWLASFVTIVALQIVFPPILRIIPCDQIDPGSDTCSTDDSTSTDPASDPTE